MVQLQKTKTKQTKNSLYRTGDIYHQESNVEHVSIFHFKYLYLSREEICRESSEFQKHLPSFLFQPNLLQSFCVMFVMPFDYASECTLADKQLWSTNTTGLQQHSKSSS